MPQPCGRFFAVQDEAAGHLLLPSGYLRWNGRWVVMLELDTGRLLKERDRVSRDRSIRGFVADVYFFGFRNSLNLDFAASIGSSRAALCLEIEGQTLHCPEGEQMFSGDALKSKGCPCFRTSV